MRTRDWALTTMARDLMQTSMRTTDSAPLAIECCSATSLLSRCANRLSRARLIRPVRPQIMDRYLYRGVGCRTKRISAAGGSVGQTIDSLIELARMRTPSFTASSLSQRQGRTETGGRGQSDPRRGQGLPVRNVRRVGAWWCTVGRSAWTGSCFGSCDLLIQELKGIQLTIAELKMESHRLIG